MKFFKIYYYIVFVYKYIFIVISIEIYDNMFKFKLNIL